VTFEFHHAIAKATVPCVIASLGAAIICFTANGAAANESLKLVELAGWPADDHLAAFAAYQASCQASHKKQHPDAGGPTYSALRNVCSRALDLRSKDSEAARTFFEANLISARVILEDGTPLRTNYGSHNGYSYTSLGRALVRRHHVPREEMSMQSIRDWMIAHPVEASKGARRQPLQYVLPHHRIIERGRTDRRAACAVDPRTVHCRRSVASIRDAVLYRGQSTNRERKNCCALRTPDDCAGHRIGDRWTGAC
jgi:MltA specific insert domain